ncbi:hypothetical protein AGMMS4952_19470 [Spirochaetia bacterium]|nr:hypothetical protein AGMMS4952_19470 [Spirochaetia bacterium]
MGQITKSLAIPSLFPKSTESFEALEKTLRYIKGRGFTMVELYPPPGHDREVAKLLNETGFASVFIAVSALKGAGFSLCAPEEAERLKAVEVLKDCLDRGAIIGSRRVLINSGFLPKDRGLVDAASESYIRSIQEAYAYIVSKGYTLDIVLEPGDSCVQSFQLLGPTDRVVETTKKNPLP